MRVRTMHFRTRNPIVGALVLLLVLAVLAAVFTVGLTLLAGLAVVGGAGLLVRRALRGRLPPPEPPLDRSREVLAPLPNARRLPPSADDPPA